METPNPYLKFLSDANAKHGNKYDYALVTENSTNNFTKDKVTLLKIICHQHREIFEHTPFQHRYYINTPCSKCKVGNRTMVGSFAENRKRYVELFGNHNPKKEEFVTQCNTIGKFIRDGFNIYNYDMFEHEGDNVKSVVACSLHDKKFEITPIDHLNGITKCVLCINEQCRSFNVDNFITAANMLHNNVYTYKYEGAKDCHSVIELTCTLCNNVFGVSLFEHVIRQVGCTCLADDVVEYTDMKVTEYATAKGGEVLEIFNKIIYDVHTVENRLVTMARVKCKYGNIWETNIENIEVRNCWCSCSYCKHRGKGNIIIREILQTLFHCEFKQTSKVLPDNLSLCGFNANLKLAYEYNHHRQLNMYNHEEMEQLKKIRAIDNQKQIECKKLGITLITIPYHYKKNVNKIYNEIMLQLTGCGMETHIVGVVDCKKIHKYMFDTDHSTIRLEEVKKYAINRGGDCLSTKYANDNDNLLFKCWKCSSSFTKTYDAITKDDGIHDTWCDVCKGVEKLTDENIASNLAILGATFVKLEYVKACAMVTFICKNNHTVTVQNVSINTAVRKKTGGCNVCRKEGKK
jgi:L-rhamnose mutarotase